MNLTEQLEKLAALHRDGALDAQEYAAAKAEALARAARPSGGTAAAAPYADPYANLGDWGEGKRSRLMQFRRGDELGKGAHLFRLEERIGAGGMGVVWKAIDVANSREGQPKYVALKMLPVEVGAKETDLKRLREEAARAREFGHPNIVQVYGWHEDETSDVIYLEMQYLEGRSLDKLLADEGTPGLGLPRTYELLTPIAEALDWVWQEYGVVHRDLKPGNVYITTSGGIKLLDFGLSAEARGSSGASRLEQDASGTLEYMPPEAGRLTKVKPSRDVFALAVMVYELLQGQCPWDSRGIQNRRPEQKPSDWPEAPEALSERQWQALQRGLAYEAEERIETCGRLIAALHEAEQADREADAEAQRAKEAKEREQEEAKKAEAERREREAREAEIRKQAEAEALEREAKSKVEAERREREAKQAEARRQAEAEEEAGKAKPTPRNPMRLLGIAAVMVLATVLLWPKPEREPMPPVGAASAAKGAGVTQKPIAAEAAPTQGRSRQGYEPEMLKIPAGRYTIGSPSGEEGRQDDEGPQHELRVGAFGLMKHEVSVEEYAAFLNAAKPGEAKRQEWVKTREEDATANHLEEVGGVYRAQAGYERHPVNHVSWHGAVAYAEWLSKETGKRYRLPTEAEWEYAARAGMTGPFNFGGISAAKANYDARFQHAGSPKGEYRGDTTAAGTFAGYANAWGLEDMHGNVYEWTCSAYDKEGYKQGKDGPHTQCAEPGQPALRALRGGSWNSKPGGLWSANRFRDAAKDRYSDVGFRLAQDP